MNDNHHAKKANSVVKVGKYHLNEEEIDKILWDAEFPETPSNVKPRRDASHCVKIGEGSMSEEEIKAILEGRVSDEAPDKSQNKCR